MPSLIKPSAKFRRPESCCPSSANILVSILVVLVIFVNLVILIILVIKIFMIMILIILKTLTILILIQLVTSGDVTVGAHLPTLAPLSESESKSKLVPLVSLTRRLYL